MQEDTTGKFQYSVVTVEKTATPDGMSGDNWYRYVIGEGQSKIVGIKSGSLREVTDHAETQVEGLNSRMGRYGSTYSSRNKS